MITQSHTTRTTARRRLHPNTHTWADANGVLYRYSLKRAVDSLYGLPLVRASLIPRGRVLTLRNVIGQELTLRGETHDERIVFFHVCGEGGTREIGAWVPVEGSDGHD